MVQIYEYIYKPKEQKRKNGNNLNAYGNFVYKKSNITNV